MREGSDLDRGPRNCGRARIAIVGPAWHRCTPLSDLPVEPLISYFPSLLSPPIPSVGDDGEPLDGGEPLTDRSGSGTANEVNDSIRAVNTVATVSTPDTLTPPRRCHRHRCLRQHCCRCCLRQEGWCHCCSRTRASHPRWRCCCRPSTLAAASAAQGVKREEKIWSWWVRSG